MAVQLLASSSSARFLLIALESLRKGRPLGPPPPGHGAFIARPAVRESAPTKCNEDIRGGLPRPAGLAGPRRDRREVEVREVRRATPGTLGSRGTPNESFPTWAFVILQLYMYTYSPTLGRLLSTVVARSAPRGAVFGQRKGTDAGTGWGLSVVRDFVDLGRTIFFFWGDGWRYCQADRFSTPRCIC